MVSALFKDWIVRLAVLLWLALVAMYLLPGVSQTWLEVFGERYLQIPTLIPVIAAAWLGLKQVPDENERRFWMILGVGFACWFVVGLPLAFVSYNDWSLSFDILGDVGYLLYYIFFILAIELRPHEQHTGSLDEKERRLRTTGLTLLGFFLLVYFALLPAAFSVDMYNTALPSFYMYILLDLVIVGRLLWMRRDTWSVRWTTIYAWLAAGAMVVAAGDIVEGLSYADEALRVPELTNIQSGTWLDHLWILPMVVFVLAIRARHVPFPAEQSVLNEPSAPRTVTRAGHILVVSAFILPFLHYALYAAGLFTGVELRALREVVSVASMVVLGGLAIAAYRTLERERDQMEATELGLLNELAVARKMDAVARLAGSVAHDFNNLVQVVRGRAEIISEQIEPGSPLHDDVRQIRSAAARAADLASQLMTFGRKQQAQTTAVRLHELIRRTVKLLKPLLDDRMRLQVDLDAKRDIVRLDPSQFERIILNLATNARDAMPEGGTITIATETPPPTAISRGLAPGVANPGRVVLTVSDTGTGMDEETINHIFEPFFTTKAEKGAGLGLAIVHGLIQQFGGSIRVDSQRDRGTAFTITLPLVSETPLSSDEEPDDTEEDDTPAAILIVEGDTTNRQLLRRLMSDLQRPILATATAAEAALIARRYSGAIALAVIDVTIEDGRALGGVLREHHAAMKVLLLAQDQPLDVAEGDELLREPFELTDILRRARDLV